MKAEKKTTTVANPRIPGVADIDSLKTQAVDLMARSVDQDCRHERLDAEAEQLRVRLDEARRSSIQAREEAVVLRLRAGGVFRQVREALLPSKGGWSKWLAEIKESHGWKETMIREAMEVHELSGGDEAKVRGCRIGQALDQLRLERQAGEARGRKPRAALAGAETRKEYGRQKEEREAIWAARREEAASQEAAQEAARELAAEFGPEWDTGQLGQGDLLRLHEMVAEGSTPGFRRLRAAWDQATEADRTAFLIWVEGTGEGER